MKLNLVLTRQIHGYGILINELKIKRKKFNSPILNKDMSILEAKEILIDIKYFQSNI